jgi:hypothetical protein
MPTTPIWQGAPGQGGPAWDAPGQGGPAWDALSQPGPAQAGTSAGEPPPAWSQPMGTAQAADARGFLSALFDFSFTSFVTARIIRVLYVLIFILALLTALVYTIVAFRLSAGFGLLTLVIGDPLFIIIVMAFWRIVLESFVVRFRIAEDVRALRERGGR